MGFVLTGTFCPDLSPFCSVWARLALFGPIWYRLAPFGPVWPRLAPFGSVWHCLAPFGTVWPPLALLGLNWPQLPHFALFGPFGSIVPCFAQLALFGPIELTSTRKGLKGIPSGNRRKAQVWVEGQAGTSSLSRGGLGIGENDLDYLVLTL